MKRLLIAALAICTIGTTIAWKKATPAAETTAVKWMTWDEMQAAQKKKPKKIIVDVYTDWCGWCKKMDANTFQHPKISKYMSDNFYCVKFNAETKDDITFKGTKYASEGRYHSFANFLMQGKMSFPTTLYMDEKLDLLTAVPGYLDPETAEKVFSYYGTNSYKSTPWEQYSNNFKSNL
jgi:thioredoxin-related protein